MGRRDLNTTAGPQMIDGKTKLRRVNHADIDHSDPCAANTSNQTFCQTWAVMSHVVSHADALRIGLAPIKSTHQRGQESPRCITDFPGIVMTELLVNQADNLVCLKYGWVQTYNSQKVTESKSHTL